MIAMKRKTLIAVISVVMGISASYLPVSAAESADTVPEEAAETVVVENTAEPAGTAEPSESDEPAETAEPSETADLPALKADPDSTSEPEVIAETDDFRYRETDDGIVIVGYKSDSEDVEIPEYIDEKMVIGIEAGVFSGNDTIKSLTMADTITKIEPNSFKNCESLTTVRLSDKIQEIGESAFENCVSLEQINMPSDLVVIYGSAFAECKSLTIVTFPDKLEYFGDGAFYNCTSLNNVIIPKAVDDFNGAVFGGCANLGDITVSEENPNYTCEANVIYSKDGKTLVAFPSAHSGVYNVPEGTETIGYAAFYKCVNLTSITLPEGLKTIENAAFVKCEGLKTIEIPYSVTSLGGYTFSGCSSLEEATIHANISQIQEYTFANCKSLKKVSVPSSVKSLGDNAFAGCPEDCRVIASDDNNISLFGMNDESEGTPVAVKVIFNGQEIEFDAQPRIMNNSVVVPMRTLFEAMTAEVSWNENERSASAELNDTLVTLIIDSNVMWKNGETIYLDAPAVILEDYTFVPLRAISEAFGANVRWDETAYTVIVDFDIPVRTFSEETEEEDPALHDTSFLPKEYETDIPGEEESAENTEGEINPEAEPETADGPAQILEAPVQEQVDEEN